MKITSVSKRNRSMSTKGNVKTDRVSYATYYSYTIDNSRVLFEEPIPLFSWDLQNYSSTIKLSVEEVDEKETSKNVISTTVEFATNFGFNATFGETVKIGPQFGSSMEESRTVSYEVATTKGNDELGDVIVDFGDAILKDTTTVMNLSEYRGQITSIDKRPYYLGLSTRYYTGWYRI